jgi:hypothetical protein
MLFSNKDSSNIQLDFIFTGIVVIVEVIGCSVGNVENSSENDFSLSIEMDPVQRRV